MSRWGNVTLFDYAEKGDLEGCKKKLSSNVVNVNNKDSEGVTALHLAAKWGSTDVVHYLVNEAGADVRLTADDGCLPLHLAAFGGHDAEVTFFLDKGVDINARDKYGDTPLMAAAGQGRISTIKLLLERGADPDVRNGNKKTAFDLAKNADTSNAIKQARISHTDYS